MISVIMRRRALMEEAVSELNSKFMEEFATLAGFWAADARARDAILDLGVGETATLDMRRSLAPGLSGQIVYAPRIDGYLSRDNAQSDDYITLKLNSDRSDYKEFCERIFPRLIDIFQPYRGAVETDSDLAMADWDIICEQSQAVERDIDGRDSVFRIWPVAYFDNILCQRSFGRNAEEVVERVSEECERVELRKGGAFLIVTTHLMTGDALNEINSRVMSRLSKILV